MRMLLPVMALVLGLAAAGGAHAQWKWRDGSGQVHFSDMPPPAGVPDKDVLQRPAARPAPTPAAAAAVAPAAAPAASASATTAGDAAARVDPELETRKKAAAQQEQARQQQEERRLAQQRIEQCERARANLRTLESGMRVASVDAKGERVVMDDRARNAEIQRARDYLQQNCRGVGTP